MEGREENSRNRIIKKLQGVGGGGGGSNIKKVGMLVENFEIDP